MNSVSISISISQGQERKKKINTWEYCESMESGQSSQRPKLFHYQQHYQRKWNQNTESPITEQIWHVLLRQG